MLHFKVHRGHTVAKTENEWALACVYLYNNILTETVDGLPETAAVVVVVVQSWGPFVG